MKSRKKFVWLIKKCKIKHSKLCNDYKHGGLKNLDAEYKAALLNVCDCITKSNKCITFYRLYNKFHHDWKIIPWNYINNALGKNLFQSKISISMHS